MSLHLHDSQPHEKAQQQGDKEMIMAEKKFCRGTWNCTSLLLGVWLHGKELICLRFCGVLSGKCPALFSLTLSFITPWTSLGQVLVMTFQV